MNKNHFITSEIFKSITKYHYIYFCINISFKVVTNTYNTCKLWLIVIKITILKIGIKNKPYQTKQTFLNLQVFKWKGKIIIIYVINYFKSQQSQFIA